jgi:hypothetical protein
MRLAVVDKGREAAEVSSVCIKAENREDRGHIDSNSLSILPRERCTAQCLEKGEKTNLKEIWASLSWPGCLCRRTGPICSVSGPWRGWPNHRPTKPSTLGRLTFCGDGFMNGQISGKLRGLKTARRVAMSVKAAQKCLWRHWTLGSLGPVAWRMQKKR